MSLRDSMPAPRQVPLAFLVAFATAAGGALGAGVLNWKFGLVTQGDVDEISAKCAPAERTENQIKELQAQLGSWPPPAEEAKPAPLYSRTKALELGTHRVSELTGNAIGDIAADKVALYTALQLLSTSAQRKAVENAWRTASSKIDSKVLQGMTVTDAASSVLKEYGVPR